jgi:hypothetical protein
MVLITPLFLSATWWPTVMQVSTTVPIVMPCRYGTTTDPMEDPSWNHAWPLVAWRISGDTMYARKCRQDTVNLCYERQIRRQIRTIIGSGTFLWRMRAPC